MKNNNPNRRCVQCGYCCSQGPCFYGEWDNDKCKFLEIENLEKRTFICTRYKDIKNKEKDCPYPMFDCGCSSPLFNDIRANVQMRRDNDKT
jgi:hypothetical protein